MAESSAYFLYHLRMKHFVKEKERAQKLQICTQKERNSRRYLEKLQKCCIKTESKFI